MSDFGLSAVKALQGKVINWLWQKLTKPGRLHFYDTQVTYCYSYYDEYENHVRTDGMKKIYEVWCRVTTHDDCVTTRIIRNVRRFERHSTRLPATQV